ncbi:hypothetical protein HHK36_026108 [Tetracentron sinense]|uniref:Zinc finger PMZ-type domain-containing protein n=1 Tax=Tetracentron sinense TaxID=13715 RepID=A0A835D3S9_TETSI|nr:hypothetical protein HHK36_026108 [Tetracentron sinense]
MRLTQIQDGELKKLPVPAAPLGTIMWRETSLASLSCFSHLSQGVKHVKNNEGDPERLLPRALRWLNVRPKKNVKLLHSLNKGFFNFCPYTRTPEGVIPLDLYVPGTSSEKVFLSVQNFPTPSCGVSPPFFNLKRAQAVAFPMELSDKIMKFSLEENHKVVCLEDAFLEEAHEKCEGCPWCIHASLLADGVTYKIKTFQSEHTNVRTTKNTNATSMWIAKKLAKQLHVSPDMKIDGIRFEIRETYGIEPSNMQLYRAWVKARDEIEGNHGKPYGKLPVYAEVVRETNSSSLVKIEYDRTRLSVNPTFKRFFICFEAMKSGFLKGCRTFKGLDGCHLKGPYGGVLLVAIALDGNNGLFPVTFAIVEGETKENWLFFLHYLHTIIGTNTHQMPLCFMTDRQKGVVEAINEIIQEATHQVCGKHLYNNFKKKFPGLNLRNHFWVAARAYNSTVFNFAMNKMKRDKKEAYEWLMEKPLHSWSRHEFDPWVRSDHVTNSMTESFNQWVGDLRNKPILTLVDSIRVKLMGRIHCEEYEVTEGVTRFVVNLHAKSCACQAWEISGLPYKHAAACLARKRANLEEYCNEYYSKETYLRAHGGIIHPIFDENMWLPGNHEPVEPPPLRRLPSRPKKNRRRELDEPAPGS